MTYFSKRLTNSNLKKIYLMSFQKDGQHIEEEIYAE